MVRFWLVTVLSEAGIKGLDNQELRRSGSKEKILFFTNALITQSLVVLFLIT